MKKSVGKDTKLLLLKFLMALIKVHKKQVVKIPITSENRSLCCSSTHYEIQLRGRKSHGMKVLGMS
jgi:hypothetical protein